MAAKDLMEYFTYEDYKNWEGRWELIDGVPYLMAPAPHPNHQKIVGRIYKELSNNLKCNFANVCDVYISPIDWKISEDTVVQPDVALFCEKIKKPYFSSTPLIVVEVLSPATEKKDLEVKFKLYENQKVPFYIIVSPSKKIAHIYKIENDKYKLFKEVSNENVEIEFENCKTEIDFNKIFD